MTRLTYDSLGRKLSMDDPDMGRWTYAYDAVDNLTSQTDARGVTTTFTYDALNRLTKKEYAVLPPSSVFLPPSVLYTYDAPTVPYATGKLVKVTDGSGESRFTYDHLGRLITEAKTIDGTPYPIQRSYDLLGRLGEVEGAGDHGHAVDDHDLVMRNGMRRVNSDRNPDFEQGWNARVIFRPLALVEEHLDVHTSSACRHQGLRDGF